MITKMPDQSVAQAVALIEAAQRIAPAVCAVARNLDLLTARARLRTEIAERYAAPMLAIAQVAERAIVTGAVAAAIAAANNALINSNTLTIRNPINVDSRS